MDIYSRDNYTRTMAEVVMSIQLTTADGKQAILKEGDLVKDMKCRNRDGVKTYTGRVRVIGAFTRYQSFPPRPGFPTRPYVHRYIHPAYIVLDCSEELAAKLVTINIGDIISIGYIRDGGIADEYALVGTGIQYRPLNVIVDEAVDKSEFALLAGTYDMPLYITKSIKFTALDSEDVYFTDELVIGEPNQTEPLEVSLKGIHFTKNATITVHHATSLEIEDCHFGDHELTEKTMLIKCTNENDVCRFSIKRNYFAKQNEYCYNLIEIYPQIADMSVFINNRFDEGSCTHNQLNLYGLEPDADIFISNNHIENSKNMVRLGFKGKPKGSVTVEGNTYDRTDTDERYAGLVLVQPYGRETASFADLTIFFESNNGSGIGHIAYLYAGENDTPFTVDNKPKAILNGEIYEIPDESPNQQPPLTSEDGTDGVALDTIDPSSEDDDILGRILRGEDMLG